MKNTTNNRPRLVLRKETFRQLSKQDLTHAQGGAIWTWLPTVSKRQAELDTGCGK